MGCCTSKGDGVGCSCFLNNALLDLIEMEVEIFQFHVCWHVLKIVVFIDVFLLWAEGGLFCILFLALFGLLCILHVYIIDIFFALCESIFL